jgi:uncharacterized membrane protein YfhO
MAIPVRAGNHLVRLQYATPGRAMGVTLSLVSLILLIGLAASVKPSAG